MRRILNILSLTVILLTCCFQGVNGQNSVGSWKTYGIFAGIDKLVDTPDKVYYVSVGQLYSYDKEYEETYSYTTSRKLNDSGISDIYYDYDNDYLVVVYGNANIDIIDSEGVVYNMPDIKDATLNVVPAINKVKFDDGKIYIATNFGIVLYSEDKKEVITSVDFGTDVVTIAIVGNDMYFVVNDKEYYKVDKNAKLSSINLDKLDIYGLFNTKDIVVLDGNKVVLLDINGCDLYVSEIDQNPGGDFFWATKVADEEVFDLQATKNGAMYHSYNKLYTIDGEGKVTITPLTSTPLATVKVGTVYEKKHIHGWNGLKELWLGSDAGIASYKMDDAGITVLSESALPDGGLTFDNVGRLYTGPSGAIYAQSYGFSMLIGSIVNGNKADNRFHINKIEGDKITEIDPIKYTAPRGEQYNTAPVGFKGGYGMLESPLDPEITILGTFRNGVFVIKDREQLAVYDNTTSSMEEFLRYQTNGMDFDKKGNLWVANLNTNADQKPRNLNFLTADKVGKVTKPEDWQGTFIGRSSQHDGKIVACKNNNTVIHADAKWQGSIFIIKTKGTDTFEDDEIIECDNSNMFDQDGLTVSYINIYSIVEDKNGKVWFGTDNGIFEITNPESATSQLVRVNHLKVPRRDGTNFADYLLSGETVISMAVDPSNRKWATTIESGVYLISENGDEILEHFDITNSPLSNNTVAAVTCGHDNSVYFGNANGLYCYKSTAAPAASDFSNVYAYPNPVRPEYNGWITITGLMDKSLVKIADAAGNVFFQGESNGGMMLWDGCDRQGRRVKTGVYYVFASQGGEGQSTTGAVTKILVVN